MKKIFITSTGTEVGKTLFLSGLIKKLKNKDKDVMALKPVISGFDFANIPNDIYHICNALNISYDEKSIDRISLYKFLKPLSPDQAAKVENRIIDFDKLVKFCNQNFDTDYLLIEGVGGCQVPLDKSKTIMDLIKTIVPDLNIMICGSYLGCLSHTISAIKNFETENLNLDMLIVTENLTPENDLYIDSSQTIASLKNFFSGKIVEIKRKTGNFEEISDMISKEIEDLIL